MQYTYTTLHNTAHISLVHTIYTLYPHMYLLHICHIVTHTVHSQHMLHTYSAHIYIHKEHYIFSICTIHVICNIPHNHTFHIFFTYIQGMLYTTTQTYIINI